MALYHKMKIADLREACASRLLPTTGTKPELIAVLKNSDEIASSSKSAASASAPAPASASASAPAPAKAAGSKRSRGASDAGSEPSALPPALPSAAPASAPLPLAVVSEVSEPPRKKLGKVVGGKQKALAVLDANFDGASKYDTGFCISRNFLSKEDITVIDDYSSKGRNVSGRSWKVRPQKRASTMVFKTAANHISKSWEEKQRDRNLKKEVRAQEAEMKEERKKLIEDKKARKAEQEKRRAANEYKSSVFQKLNITGLENGKMKAMSKKQLRMIKKTRMNSKTGEIELVNAYAK